MSAIIREGKMCFSVFGRGYEDTRVSSGEGIESEEDRYAILTSGAVLDSTGQYLWIALNGQVSNRKLLKYDLETFTDVGQTIITAIDSAGYMICHPSNVANNYGVAVSGSGDWYVFNLTDDTVYCSGNVPNLDILNSTLDCILVGDKIYILELKSGRSGIWEITIDLTNQTATKTLIMSGRTSVCYTDDSHIFNNYPPEWFYQKKSIYLSDLSGNTVWTQTASESGGDGYPNVGLYGFGGNGKLYLPTKIYGSWRIGEYNTNTVPDLTTPKPKRFFGKFENIPSIETRFPRKGVAYNDGRTRCAFTTDNGTYVTDLEEVELLTEEEGIIVYCMNDTHVVCTNATYQRLYVFKYR